MEFRASTVSLQDLHVPTNIIRSGTQSKLLDISTDALVESVDLVEEHGLRRKSRGSVMSFGW
jgi:hypothetical protein